LKTREGELGLTSFLHLQHCQYLYKGLQYR